jgi:alkaline phosphatase D
VRNLNKLFLIVLFFTNSLSATDVFKMAFGSCLHQNYPAPIWTAIKQNNIDSFFFLGDNIYGDTPSGLPWKLKSSYELQKKSIPSWVQSIEQYSIWDDHDYGKNNAGAEYKFKQKAENLYLDFWNISSDDERRSRPGIYYASVKSVNNNKVLIVGLDTRYFRSNIQRVKGAHLPNLEPSATILGTEQWAWLKRTLEIDHDLLILASSIQVIPTEHRFEKWSNIPAERERLLQLLTNHSAPTMIISGDRHRGGIYQYENILEVTSSSLNRNSSQNIETDALLLGQTYPQNNFGLLTIGTDSLTVELIDKDNNTLESALISF